MSEHKMADLRKISAGLGFAAIPLAGALLPADSIVPHQGSPWRALFLLGLFIQIASSVPAYAQAEVEPGKFGWKPSGFENLVVGGASHGRGEGASGSSETEVELTPQYKTKSSTIFAARGVINLLAASNAGGSSSQWQLSFPEVSVFAVGNFGRIEAGDRAGFPQTLIGYYASEIAFTSAEFGPDGGKRLDPSGGLPTLFLPHPVADRINSLSYLGYAERFYDSRSLKLIYVTPRSRTGFYGAFTYTPSTDISSGFTADGATKTPYTGLQDAGSSGVFRNIVQAAGVWVHRTQNIDLSAGSTYSYARASAANPTTWDSNSLTPGLTMTLHDALTFGLSGTYDGFSDLRKSTPGGKSPISPYGVVGSINYVAGSWALGGYYQHATANSLTPQSSRDTVNIEEAGISRLVDQNHHLLGAGYYTDARLFAAVYCYQFDGAELSNVAASQNGATFLFGARFAFF